MEDNENHRINDCILYRKTNNYNELEKFDYKQVYSDNLDELKRAAEKILNIWDLANGKNSMKSIETEDVE